MGDRRGLILDPPPEEGKGRKTEIRKEKVPRNAA